MASTVVLAALSACTVRYVSPAQQCQMSGRIDCHEDFVRMKSYTDDRSVFGSQANLFDATYASASVAGSNVALITDRTTATIRLKRSGGTIGTANFPMFAINGSFMFTNPSEVTSWVRSNAPEADEYEISLDTISFEKKAGTNVVVVEWLYDDSVLSGGSWSGYSPANGSGGSNQQQ